MNGLPYYKRYPRDFIEGTVRLSFELKTTYAFILDLIYLQGGYLPDDPRYIAGLLGVSVRKWNSLRQGLIDAEKIQESDGSLTNYRALSELESLAKVSRKMSENRSRPNKNKDLPSRKKNQTDTDTETPYNPPGDFDAFWALCPKRVGKKSAQAKYAKAVKDGVSPDLIHRAMKTYAQSDQVKRGYAKHPVTWLNQGCWDDEVSVEASNDDRLSAWGIKDHDAEDARSNFSRGRDSDPPPDWNAEDGVSDVLPFPQEEDRPVPERDLQAGRDRLALLALRA